MCTSFCPNCDGDHLNDGPVCLACIQKTERLATIDRLVNLAADDDGEVFIPMTPDELAATHARMAASPEPSF